MRKNGFSLIELLVVVGIMSVLAVGVMTMMDNQNKDFKFLAEKFEIRDTKSILTGVLDENAFCGCFLSGKTLNTTTGQINEAVSSIPLSYTNPGCVASSQKIIPTVGSKLSGSSNLTVGSISILPGTEIATGSGKYSTSLEINFENVSRSVRPMTVPIFFKVDLTSGSAVARPVSTCINAVVAPLVQGFCTPMNPWDNSNVLPCDDIAGYTKQRLTGVYGSGIWRGSGCCYIPDSDGGNGWCGPQYPSWLGSFSGCGAGNASFSVFKVQGIKSGSYDQSQCCFIPKTLPKNPQAFSTGGTLTAWDSASGCGGPFTYFKVIYQNTVTGGSGREISCTYVPK
jgi:prepilin-type N-terminal cleavage/methylation domain-containing protein